MCVVAYYFSPKFATVLLNKISSSFLGANAPEEKVRIFSKEELATFKGENTNEVYLALVGHVFDVSKGKKHYGRGGGYSFFAGVDGSKAFVTGKFVEEDLTDDISELTTSEILSLENWKAFYEKDYKYIGKVEGAFFDKKGQELPMMELYRKKLRTALLEKNVIENDKKLFPPCNSEWSQGNGGRVWCSTRSGGVARDWSGVPRLYYSAGSTQPRCACVRTTGPPSHDLLSKTHNDQGDLDNPNLNVYPNCDALSESCPLPDSA